MQQTNNWTIFSRYLKLYFLTLFSYHSKLLDPIQKPNNYLPTTSRVTFVVCSLTLIRRFYDIFFQIRDLPYIFQAPLKHSAFPMKEREFTSQISRGCTVFSFPLLLAFGPCPSGCYPTRGPPTVKGFKYRTF